MGRKSPSDPSFLPFGSIPRLHRPFVITEKIDGTNGLVHIALLDEALDAGLPMALETFTQTNDNGESRVVGVWAGSRNRWLALGDDNFAFAAWVKANAAALVETLDLGSHYGEWWGQGVARKYGLTEKRFSLFNVARWSEEDVANVPGLHVVPVLGRWDGSNQNMSEMVRMAVIDLKANGSKAAPGFMKPEGVIAWHEAARQMFKATVENDEIPKALVGRE